MKNSLARHLVGRLVFPLGTLSCSLARAEISAGANGPAITFLKMLLACGPLFIHIALARSRQFGMPGSRAPDVQNMLFSDVRLPLDSHTGKAS